MHIVHDLWDMHLYMVCNHAPNLVTISPVIPVLYSSATHFHTLHAARATHQADTPNEFNLVVVNFIEWIYLSEKTRAATMHTFGDISFSKALPGGSSAATGRRKFPSPILGAVFDPNC